MFKQKLLNFVLIGLADCIAVGTLWFIFSHQSKAVPLPQIIKQSLPARGGILGQLPVRQVAPLPGQQQISGDPQLTIATTAPLSNDVSVTLTPDVSFQPLFSNDRKQVTAVFYQPLLPNTAYVASITDNTAQLNYSWVFTTGATTLDAALLPAVDQVKQQMPYKDPFNHFSIVYAAQVDTFFILIHNDTRADTDKTAAIAWLAQQGVSDISGLQVQWIPSNNL